MRNVNFFLILIIFIFYNVNISFTQPNIEKTPDEVINELLTLFKSYKKKKDDKPLTDEEKKINREIADKIENIFNYNEMINGVLFDQKGVMTEKERIEFFTKFKKLIGLVAFPQASSFYNNNRVTLNKAVLKDDKAFINTINYNYEKDISFAVVYVFKKFENKWMLIDVEINEHSLVESYRMQVNRLVKKDGVKLLMETLNKRYEEYSKDE